MTTAPFIHLHVHTAYSLLEGAVKVDKLVSVMQQEKIPAVAMTDTGNIFGAMAFAHEGMDKGVQPILGTQLLIKTPVKEVHSPLQQNLPTFDTVVLLVQNATGYANLLQLFSLYYMEPDKQITPHITLEELSRHTEGLIVLSGGVSGILGRLLLQNDKAFALEIASKLQSLFPNRFYIELQRHNLPEEQKTEPLFLEIAKKLNIPIVATNEVFFLDKAMYEAHDAFICIAEKTFVAEQNRRRLTPEHYLKSPQEMVELFSDLPEAIENTVKIAQRCYFMAEDKKPAFPLFDCGEYTEVQLLQIGAREGLKSRLEKENIPSEEIKEYEERLEYELSIIEQMGFAGYFLIVADFIKWSKANGVPVGPGRGSGAGSLVAWALTITDVNPLRFNLLFERFLNPERVSMPDFDVDFCQENREKTIRYVQEKYGFDHVAQIITFGKLQAKAVLRDVGRVLQIPIPVVDRLAKLIPNTLGITLAESLEQEPALLQQAKQDEAVDLLLKTALQLEGLYRNTSTHAAGVVIGDKPLKEIIPIYKDPSSDMPVTQYDMKYVEKASLIKFDFLGLKTLTVLAKTLELLRLKNIQVDLDNLPLDDRETFKLLCAANTVGVFQLESSGMRKILKDMQPDKIEDIIALVSLYRPGPMENIPSYIARKKGEEKCDYMHPLIEDILKETYGIMIYQEQVMQISQKMAGYTLGGADLLRRAMGKKKIEEMQKQRAIFVAGAKEKGVAKETAEMVFDKMEKFASYGFNKSHATAYAYISYQTAYLKAHYPAEFMAATMTLDKTNTDKLEIFKTDLQKANIPIMPPNINVSHWNFTVQGNTVIYALAAIKNVGEAAMQQIVEEREKNGPFKSVQDLLSRVDATALNKRYLEGLIRSGALDCLSPNRAELLENTDKLLAYAADITAERNSTQISLFGDVGDNTRQLKLNPARSWSLLEKLSEEKDAIGFYLSAHPLDSFDTVFQRLRVVLSSQVEDLVKNTGSAVIKMAGIISSVRTKINQKGNKFAFITATDKSGTFEMICFSQLLSSSSEILNSKQPVLLTVSVEEKDGMIRKALQNVSYLSEEIAKTDSVLLITLDSEKSLPKIQNILSKEPNGQSKIFFLVSTSVGQVEIQLPKTYALHPATVEELQALPDIVEIKYV